MMSRVPDEQSTTDDDTNPQGSGHRHARVPARIVDATSLDAARYLADGGASATEHDNPTETKTGPTDGSTYAFRQAPPQPGKEECPDCYGLGWTLTDATVEACTPCDVYEDNSQAARAATAAIDSMYQRLGPGEELARGYGYETFVLHPLPEATDSCPDCDSEFTAIEAGYDRYGSVTLENKVLCIEDEGFSDDGNGPSYLYCGRCERAYALPPTVEHR